MKNGTNKQTEPADRPLRTEAQKQALRDAYVLLTKEFEDVLMVCSMRADHAAVGTDLEVYWRGGWPMARTLADFAKDKIVYTKTPHLAPK